MSKKELVKEEKAVEETANEAVETAVTEEAVEKTAKKKTSKKATEKEAVIEETVEAKETAEEVEEAEIADENNGAEDEEVTEVELGAEEKPAKKATKKRTSRKTKEEFNIVTINGERSVLTDEDKYKADMLDIVESKKVNKILSDTITGIEKYGDTTCAVLRHGAIKVIIPAQLLVDISPDEVEGDGKVEYGHHAIRRLGAEIDYVVERIDEKEGVAVGNRVKAMQMKQKRYYLSFDKNGNKIIYPDAYCEARIVSVTRTGVFAEIFGVETFIRFNELSYKRLASAEDEFTSGMRVLVKILDVKIEDKKVKISASIKKAQNNPYEEALKKYSVDNLYTGRVTVVDENGVFVSLDGGVDCLCKFPDRGRPTRGARATVRIIGIDKETNRIWGVITHMSNVR